MTFHYIRKNDSNGTIQRVNGMGMGLPLLKLQGTQRKLPLACNIEIIRFAADILNDSLKNKFVHGDIKMENLSVLNDGSLIINGYDRPRRNSITPEGNISLPGDIYGLGIVMLELLSGKRTIELPLDENLHNQTVLQIFLGIEWQEWAQQPWLSTMQEYLISLLFYDPGQRPHPLDIANILKEAAQTTTSLNVQQYMMHNGLSVKSEQESLEMARTLRSSTLISPVEVMADSEGTATGYFTRDKIAQMFQEPVEEERARRTEWSPDTVSENQTVDTSMRLVRPTSQPIPTPQRPEPQVSGHPQQMPRVPKPTAQQPQDPWSNHQSVAPPPQQHSNTRSSRQSVPTWQEQPTATNPTPPPIPRPSTHQTPVQQPWQAAPPSIPVQEQPTPSLPPKPQNRHTNPVPVQAPPRAPQQPFAIGVGQQSIPNQTRPASNTPSPNWATPPPPSPPNITIGTRSPSGGLSGGINKWIIIGGAGLALLLLTMGLLVWQLFFTNTDETASENSTTGQITLEQIVPEKPEDIEVLDEPEEQPVKVNPKPTVEKPLPKKKATTRTSSKSQTNKPKKSSSSKASTRKSTPKKSKTQQSTLAPTTVGVGEFSVTITFQKEATLKCGDGQSKDFVRQTTMTFQTRTACRINTEDGERGALTASKSGTIQCSLSGERIRCK